MWQNEEFVLQSQGFPAGMVGQTFVESTSIRRLVPGFDHYSTTNACLVKSQIESVLKLEKIVVIYETNCINIHNENPQFDLFCMSI